KHQRKDRAWRDTDNCNLSPSSTPLHHEDRLVDDRSRVGSSVRRSSVPTLARLQDGAWHGRSAGAACRDIRRDEALLAGKRIDLQRRRWLVKAGADPRLLSEILSTPMSRSERVARLKAARRSQIILMGNWIVA